MLKKAFVVTLLSLSISTAYATNGTSVVDNNSGIQGVGLATSGSQSIGNSSSNIGVSSNSNIGNSSATNTATGGTANAQGGSSLQGQGQKQSQTNAGNNSSNTASNAAQGNTTTVSGGETTVERSAPGVFIGTAIQPIGTCRLSVAGGGSNVAGSFAGGIPIGNDMTCLVDARDKLMQRLPTVFSELDRTLNACMIEGMSEFKACKEAKRRFEELQSKE